MSKNIKKIVAAIFSFILVAAVVGRVYAFKAESPERPTSRASQIWVFNGTSTADITNPDAYTHSQSAPQNCQPGTAVPCYIESDATTSEELASSFEDLEALDVMSLAPVKRSL